MGSISWVRFLGPDFLGLDFAPASAQTPGIPAPYCKNLEIHEIAKSPMKHCRKWRSGDPENRENHDPETGFLTARFTMVYYSGGKICQVGGSQKIHEIASIPFETLSKMETREMGGERFPSGFLTGSMTEFRTPFLQKVASR